MSSSRDKTYSGNICIFCYKSSPSVVNDINSKDSRKNTANIVKRFFKLLERFCSAYGCVTSDTTFEWLKWLDCCKNCFDIVHTFCQDYHQLKVLELRLTWKLERLSYIMKFAGRVPSRVAKLNEIFNTNFSENNQSNQYHKTFNGEGTKKLQIFKLFHHNVANLCNKRFFKSQPCVSVRRKANGQNNSNHKAEKLDLVDGLKYERDEKRENDDLEDWIQPFHSTDENIDDFYSDDQIDHSAESIFETRGIRMVQIDGGNGGTRDGTVEEMEQTFNSVKVEVSEVSGQENVAVTGPSLSKEYSCRRKKRKSDTEMEAEEHANEDSDSYHEDGSPFSSDLSGSEMGQDEKGSSSNMDAQKEKQQPVSSTSHNASRVNSKTSIKSKFQCATCKQRFRLKATLQRHMLTVHNEKARPLECQICQTKFISRKRMSRHIKIVHGERIHKCAECNKVFKTKDKLELHEFIHKDPTTWKFQCTFCGKRDYSKGNFDKHMLTHTRITKVVKKFICKICSNESSNRKKLLEHVRSEHLDKGDVGSYKVFPCLKCNQQFISKEMLKSHMKSVHAEATHQCSECGKAFKSAYKLDIHSFIHKDPSEWKFQCSTCGFMAYTKGNLDYHMKKHNVKKEENFSCKVCDNKFENRHQLQLHFKREHVEKGNVGDLNIFQCSICDRKFVNKSALGLHKRKAHGVRK